MGSLLCIASAAWADERRITVTNSETATEQVRPSVMTPRAKPKTAAPGIPDNTTVFLTEPPRTKSREHKTLGARLRTLFSKREKTSEMSGVVEMPGAVFSAEINPNRAGAEIFVGRREAQPRSAERRIGIGPEMAESGTPAGSIPANDEPREPRRVIYEAATIARPPDPERVPSIQERPTAAPSASGAAGPDRVAIQEKRAAGPLGRGLEPTLPLPEEPAIATPPGAPPKLLPLSSAPDHPTAIKTRSLGVVKSPYPPHRDLDVRGLASGSLAKDPSTGEIFRLP